MHYHNLFKVTFNEFVMKNVINFIMVTVLLVLLVGFVGADSTEITGTIYNANTYAPIANATVTVNCNDNEQVVVSAVDGQYSAIYNNSDNCFGDFSTSSSCNAFCVEGDSLIETAVKDGMTGMNTGIVGDDPSEENWDLGIIHVPMVPEFGFFLGILTMISAVGIFFVVRK